MTTESTNDGDALPRWYVIQCKGGESFRASEHLDNQGYEVFHPVLEVQKRRRGKLVWVAEPLFPHYLFIRLDRLASNWRPIRSTRGVLRLVGFGHEPVAVQDALIETLRDMAAEGVSVIIVLHDHDQLRRLADRVLHLDRGHGHWYTPQTMAWAPNGPPMTAIATTQGPTS